MAKKKETLSYLQVPLPAARRYYRMVKRSWDGLNYAQTIDTGALSMEKNISTIEAPYLTPSETPTEIANKYTNPIGVYGFDDFILVVYCKDSAVKVDYISPAGTYSGVLDDNYNNDYPRSIVQFNHYDNTENPLESGITRKLLIFPDAKSMDFEVSAASLNNDGFFEFERIEVTDDDGKILIAAPKMKYVAVQQSRLFGVDDNNVFASGFNDYTNWKLDTAADVDTDGTNTGSGYNENNAWYSASQSNTKADGKFTGITSFQNHIVCFKRDFMHEIYNNKNPFRIQDIYAEGAIDNRTIQDVDGRLIFVSDDGVKVYTGSNPRLLSYPLGVQKFEEAISGTDGRCYYLYCKADGEKRLFVYNTVGGQWSEMALPEDNVSVVGFAHNKNGMYMLCSNGVLYKLDTKEYGDWSFETDLITNETVDIKRLKKIQMLAEIAPGSTIKVYLLYDQDEFDSETATPVYSYEKDKNDSGNELKAIRVKPRNTSHYGMKLHVEGSGYVKLYELELSVEEGGKLYV